MAAKAKRAFAVGADLVEFRLDLLRAPDMARVRRSLGTFAERAIFTFRRSDEGGGFRGRESERLVLLEESAGLGPAYMDVELRTLKANPGLAGARLGRKIVSWHDITGTPSRERLLSLMTEISAHGGLPKIVPMARNGLDNLSVLSLYDQPGPAPIAFCMGQAGLFSRVMAIERETPIAYASLDGEQTAAGQFPLGHALAIRRRFESA